VIHNDTRSTECYVIVMHNDTRSTKCYVIVIHNDTRSTECYVIVMHNDTRSTERYVIVIHNDTRSTERYVIVMHNDTRSIKYHIYISVSVPSKMFGVEIILSFLCVISGFRRVLHPSGLPRCNNLAVITKRRPVLSLSCFEAIPELFWRV
jgi:hypothetical protein